PLIPYTTLFRSPPISPSAVGANGSSAACCEKYRRAAPVAKLVSYGTMPTTLGNFWFGNFRRFAAIGMATIFLMSCTSTNNESAQNMNAKSRPFGATRGGEPVEIYTLTNGKGAEAAIMTY